MLEQNITDPFDDFLQYLDLAALEVAEGPECAFPEQGFALPPPSSARISDPINSGHAPVMLEMESQSNAFYTQPEIPNRTSNYPPQPTPMLPENLQISGEAHYSPGLLYSPWDPPHGDLIDWHQDRPREWGMDVPHRISEPSNSHPRREDRDRDNVDTTSYGASPPTPRRGDQRDRDRNRDRDRRQNATSLSPSPSKHKHKPHPQPRTPSRKSSYPNLKAARNHSMNRSPSLDFINYTASDSMRILTGVAPSGSSRTKARREKEASEQRRKLSLAAMRAVRAAGGDVERLVEEGVFV